MAKTGSVKVDTSLHEKMKSIAKVNKNNLVEEYEIAISKHIENETQKQILIDSQIEQLINKKMDNIDKHLASFLGKIDKEISILYTTESLILQKILSVYAETEISIDDLMEYLEDKSEHTYIRLIRKLRENKKANEKWE